MTQNNDYATQKLLESLFGKSGYEFKNLNEEERKALRVFGYSVIDWDILLSEGKLTKEDVHKRVAVYKQLQVLDDELQNRKPKKESKFKKAQVLNTWDRGKIFITKVIEYKDNYCYEVTTEDGVQDTLEEVTLQKILK